MDLLDLLEVQGTVQSPLQHHNSKASLLWCSVFFIVQLSHPYMTTGKTIAFTRWTFVVDQVFTLCKYFKNTNYVICIRFLFQNIFQGYKNVIYKSTLCILSSYFVFFKSIPLENNVLFASSFKIWHIQIVLNIFIILFKTLVPLFLSLSC